MESANAATFYLKQQGGAPMTVKSIMVNSFAHGFYAGFRKAEKDYGITKPE